MGAEARLSYLLTAVAGGFAMTVVRNETQRHSAALKNAGQNPIGLLPLYGSGFAVPSFQLHPVSLATPLFISCGLPITAWAIRSVR